MLHIHVYIQVVLLRVLLLKLTTLIFQTLKTYSKVRYGYSFYLAWIGTAIFLVSSILYWAAAVTWLEQVKRQKAEYSNRTTKYKREYVMPQEDPYATPYGYQTYDRNPYSGMMMLMGPQYSASTLSSMPLATAYNPYDFYSRDYGTYDYGGGAYAYPY